MSPYGGVRDYSVLRAEAVSRCVGNGALEAAAAARVAAWRVAPAPSRPASGFYAPVLGGSCRRELVVSPEVISFRCVDLPGEARRLAREFEAAAADLTYAAMNAGVEVSSAVCLDLVAEIGNCASSPVGSRGVVTAWSSKSRQRLSRTMAALDLSGRFSMLTLTLDGDWMRKPLSGGGFVWRTPSVASAELSAWRKRMSRRYGVVRAVWKVETQRRGAPHYHLGVLLPEFDPRSLDARGAKRARASADAAYLSYARESWHSIVCHDGAVCGGGCHHARHGVHGDFSYADRVRSGRSTLAAYFAKHAMWRSKDYQHASPATVVRAGLDLDERVIVGVTKHSQFEGSRIMTVERPVYGLPSSTVSLLAFCVAWDTPGRWWGVWHLSPVVSSVVPDVPQDVYVVLRLLCRKVFARRTQRLVAAEVGGRLVAVTVRRQLRSLCGSADRGFWLLARDGPAFAAWLLETATALRALRGVDLARALSLVALPDSEPTRVRYGARRVAVS